MQRTCDALFALGLSLCISLERLLRAQRALLLAAGGGGFAALGLGFSDERNLKTG